MNLKIYEKIIQIVEIEKMPFILTNQGRLIKFELERYYPSKSGTASNNFESTVFDDKIKLIIERIVEIDFLFGSRRQEGQRLGRLFHGEGKGEHIILMSQREFENYSKRLYSIYEKGFKIQIIR